MHKMSNPVFLEKNKKTFISLSFAEFAQRVVKAKAEINLQTSLFEIDKNSFNPEAPFKIVAGDIF